MQTRKRCDPMVSRAGGGNLLSYFIPSDRVYDNNTALPVVLALNYVIHASRNLFTNLESSGSSKPVNK